MNYRLRHVTGPSAERTGPDGPETAQPVGKAAVRRWLSDATIMSEVAVRSYQNELNHPRSTPAYAEIIAERFTADLIAPRALWDEQQRSVIADGDIDEMQAASKAKAARCLALLPQGSCILVVARPGRELYSQDQDGRKDVLSWPLESHGTLLTPATRPISMSEFFISDKAGSAQVDFSRFNEPIVSDGTKTVTLTFSEKQSDTDLNQLESRDFAVFVRLPQLFERMLATTMER